MNDTASGLRDPAPHYAEAFAPVVGRCFRLVHRPGGEGQPMRCQEPPAWRGRFGAFNGRIYIVDACSGHAGPLTNRRPAARPKT